MEIDARTRRVREWSDLGGTLNVKLQPGKGGTGARFWTMGSHEDDVLRMQGTPRSILKHGSTETWFYGASSVEIDARTRRVREWSDLGGTLKVRMRSRTE